MSKSDALGEAGRTLTGLPVTNQDAERLGRVRSVFLDLRSLRPSWVLVGRRWPQERLRPIPLAEALVCDKAIVVPYTLDDLRLAPEHPRRELLTAAREQQFVDHYNVGFGTSGTTGPHTGVPAPGNRVTETAGAVPLEAAASSQGLALRRLRRLASA